MVVRAAVNRAFRAFAALSLDIIMCSLRMYLRVGDRSLVCCIVYWPSRVGGVCMDSKQYTGLGEERYTRIHSSTPEKPFSFSVRPSTLGGGIKMSVCLL